MLRRRSLGLALSALICFACHERGRATSLSSFIKHEVAQPQARPEVPHLDLRSALAQELDIKKEATLAKLRADAEAQAKLRVPKVALLFLTRGDMPHESAWSAWLGAARGLVPLGLLEPGVCTVDPSLKPAASTNTAQETYKLRRRIFVEQALFSIYLHPSPEFKGYPKDSVFYGHSVRLRVKVSWGAHSEVEAMRLLVRTALRQPLNQHFVFLCETSIPIYPPTVVYQELMLGGKSKIDACPKENLTDPVHSVDRWKEEMQPLIPRELWRKSGQWITLTRKHAQLVAEDQAIATEFEEHCEHEANEHYFGVLLASLRLENETTCSSNAMSCVWPWQSGDLSHPVTFQADQITPELILERRQNTPDWHTNPVCRDKEAIKSAARAFVTVGPDWRVGCHWSAAKEYDLSHLRRTECTLFARKMSPFGNNQVLDVMTSCDKRLKIAPKKPCRRQGSGFWWDFW